MSKNEIPVSNGPDKSDLLRAVSNPSKHLHVSFDTPVDPLEVHIDRIEEMGDDGLTFGLSGHIASGNLRGAIEDHFSMHALLYLAAAMAAAGAIAFPSVLPSIG
jgi:hypothetical protein